MSYTSELVIQLQEQEAHQNPDDSDYEYQKYLQSLEQPEDTQTQN